MSETQQKLELVRLYYRQGSFQKSLSAALEVLDQPETRIEESAYLQFARMALQNALELNRLSEVTPYIDEVRKIQGPWADFVLGIWELGHAQADKGQHYFEEALKNSIGDVNHELTCRLLHALASAKLWKKENSEAEALIEKVLFLSKELQLDEIRASGLILKANTLSSSQKIEEALETLWESYEIAKRGFYFNIQANVLLYIANVYRLSGNTKLMQTYANVAIKGLDEDKFPRIHQLAKGILSSAQGPIKMEPDLRINVDQLKARVRGKGFIEFGHQHILFDLLMLLAMHPGKRFSKEQLIGRVWKQMYDPSTHDNLIYVSVKRLRNILEPDEASPIFVLRDRQGYYLAPQAVVEMAEGDEVR